MPRAQYTLLRVMVRDDMMEWLRDRAATATDDRGRFIYVSEVVREALSRYKTTERRKPAFCSPLRYFATISLRWAGVAFRSRPFVRTIFMA